MQYGHRQVELHYTMIQKLGIKKWSYPLTEMTASTRILFIALKKEPD